MRCGNTVLSCLKLLAQAEGKISFYDIFEGVYFQMQSPKYLLYTVV